MLVNTGVAMWYQAMNKGIADKQLEQAKKQYTLDSLRYEQVLKFTEEYKSLKERELKIDSLAAASAKKSAEAQIGLYKIEVEKKDEYVKAMRKAANGR
jgi:hypothetical protein